MDDKAVEDFVEEIKQCIYEETRSSYGDAVFERWLNPLHQGTMPDPDGFARLEGVCGDFLEIYLRFEGGRVKDALYRTNGCGSSSVCGSFAAQMAIGKDPVELMKITGSAILKEIGGLPRDDMHCAFHAANALHAASDHYLARPEGGTGS